MMLLDTNVFSALMHPESSEQILRWLGPTGAIVCLDQLRDAEGDSMRPDDYAARPAPGNSGREMQFVLRKDIEGRIALFDATAARN